MKLKAKLLLGAALALGLAGAALSQSGIISTTLTGNEVVVCAIGGPGGPSIFCPVAELRNTTGYQNLSTASNSNVSPTNLVNSLLVSIQQGASPTNIFTPFPPYDAELFQVCNVTNGNFATTPMTLNASAGSSMATGAVTTLTTLNARVCDEYQYVAPVTTWYQIR